MPKNPKVTGPQKETNPRSRAEDFLWIMIFFFLSNLGLSCKEKGREMEGEKRKGRFTSDNKIPEELINPDLQLPLTAPTHSHIHSHSPDSSLGADKQVASFTYRRPLFPNSLPGCIWGHFLPSNSSPSLTLTSPHPNPNVEKSFFALLFLMIIEKSQGTSVTNIVNW